MEEELGLQGIQATPKIAGQEEENLIPANKDLTNNTSPAPVESQEPPKKDWFTMRVVTPSISTKDLFDVFGTDGFDEFKPKEEYWKDPKIKEVFNKQYGFLAKDKFDDAYENSKKEYASFQLGQYQRSQTGYELVRDDLSALRTSISTRFENMLGTVQHGTDWTMPTKDYRENFSTVKVKEKDENGNVTFVLKEYSPELLKELEKDTSFGGLAYSDAFYNINPNEGVNGLYFNSIYDGKVLDEATNSFKDVREDQVVSRWDIDTGPTNVLGMFNVNLDRILKNNKLEADGVLDYAKILVKAPLNMAINVMDTGVQLIRAAVAGGYGIAGNFTDDDLDVNSSEAYKWLSTKGVRLKGNKTSMTREALQDGFFGSLEAALTTTADIALQIALAGALGRAGASVPSILDRGLQGQALIQAQNRAAEVFVRSTLTAMAVKDSYNEAINNGYSTSEASLITGAMGAAMWKATRFSSYILGDHGARQLRANIKSSMKAELEGTLKQLIGSVSKTAVTAGETKAKYSLESMQRAVKNVFGKVVQDLPANRFVYAAREEALEEMAEELFQDGVKQAASAYGYLINNAHAAGKGRYLSIFDDGYFPDAVGRYASSAVGGALGGPMGMIGNKVHVSPISSSSSMVDILLDGRKSELLSVLSEMKNEGILGPKTLSTEYNEKLEAFEPIVKGSGSPSLADMVFTMYHQDINVVDTFINKGMFNTARQHLQNDPRLKEFVNNNSMRKDFVSLAASMIDILSTKGITMSFLDDLDQMTEATLLQRLPEKLKEINKNIKDRNLQIEQIKDQAKDPAKVSDTAKEGKPKTIEKEEKKNKVIGDSEESSMTRLEKEAKLSNTVSEMDLLEILSNYRKIRAIGTGVSAEYYLLQNDIASDPILGAKYNRLDKYSNLGEEPLKDMLMAMRFRSMDDAKVHAQTALAAQESESIVTAVKDLTDINISSLEKELTERASLLSETSLKSIVDLFNKADLKPSQEAITIDGEFSVFTKGIDGKDTDQSIVDLYKEILMTSPENESMMPYIEVSSDEARKFFKKAAKDLNKVRVPIWDANENDGRPEHAWDGELLVPSILARGSKLLNTIVAESGTLATRASNVYSRANKMLEEGVVYRDEPFKKKNLNSLFKRESGGTLSSTSLSEDGMSVVRALKDSEHEGIYTYSDTSRIDEVLKQIDIRLAMTSTLAKFVQEEGGNYQHYFNMLAGFRKSVLDIIDFKYEQGSSQDTDIEEHSYKDYTVTSDYFVDHIFDPLNLKEALTKDSTIRTKADIEEIDNYKRSRLMLMSGVVDSSKYPAGTNFESLTQIPLENLIETELPIQEEILFQYLESRYKEGFLDGAELLEGQKVILVPNAVFGVIDEGFVPTHINGAFELYLAKWLFKNTRDVIATVADKATILPYTQAKDNDIAFTYSTLKSIFDDSDIVGLKDIIKDEDPELYIDLMKDVDSLSKTDVGALNIRIEQMYFKIYNNTGLKVSLEANEHSVIVNELEIRVYKVSDAFINQYTSDTSYINSYSENLKKLSTLIGAFTTDFTPFYTKFKRDIKAMGKYDRMVVAAQEHAAKHSGAYLYSEKYKELADAVTKNRLRFEPEGYSVPISAVYVTGVAGSGKSSSVIKMGMKIASEIIEDAGYSNNAILPVSVHDSQVQIVANSVGDLSKGNAGMTVNELLTLLRSAVHDNIEESIDKLSTVGVIAIDEATYVEGRKIGEPNSTSELDQLNSLINVFNNKYNNTGHKIGLVMLGDPKQSGHLTMQNDMVYDTSVNIRRVHPIAYMDFSFRSRNSFLVDSISTITDSINSTKATTTGAPSFLKVQEGTKYGTTAGKFYGMKIINSADKGSSADFYKVLNDDTELISNIEANLKRVAAKNSNLADGEEPEVFTVLLAPSDVATYLATPSKIKEISEREEYKKYFKVVAAKEVGGSEANYVIGETLPSEEESGNSSSNLGAVSKNLNTLATRAFDYVVIVNRSNEIVVPNSGESIRIPDGKVMISDTALDNAAKENLKKNYLEILKDIPDVAAAPIQVPVIQIPGIKITVPKGQIATKFTMLTSLTGKKDSLLSINRTIEDNKGLDDVERDIIVSYLDKVGELLVTDDDTRRADIIEELDGLVVNNDLSSLLSEEAYANLVGIQVFVESLYNNSITDNSIVIERLSAGIRLGGFSTSINKYLLDSDIVEGGPTTKEFLKEAENILSDPTQATTLGNLFEAAVDMYSTESEESVILYNKHLDDFMESRFPLISGNIGDLKLSQDDFSLVLDTLEAAIKVNALAYVKPVPETAPDIDLIAAANILAEFSIAINTYTESQIDALLVELSNGSDSVSLPEGTEVLFDLGYNPESVIKALYDAALLVQATIKANKKEEAEYENDIKRLETLKQSLGISTAIVGSTAVYEKLVEYDTQLSRQMFGKADVSSFASDVSDLVEAQNLWNKLYRGVSTAFGEDGYGQGFINRGNLNSKETLEDYVKNINRGKNLYTVGVTAFNKWDAQANLGKPTIYLTPDEAIKRFGYSDMVDEVPSKVVLRIIGPSKNRKVVDVVILAATPTTNYAVAQLDNVINKDPKLRNPAVEQLIKELTNYYNDPRTVKQETKGRSIVDLPIDGDIKRILFARAGGIVTAENAEPEIENAQELNYDPFVITPTQLSNGEFGLLSLADLKANIKIGGSLFVDTRAANAATKGLNIGNLRGEMYTLYSTNKNGNLDSSSIIKTIKAGGGMDSSNRIQDNTGNLPTSLGVMRFNLKAPLDKLGMVLKNNPDISMGAFVSDFSIALQSYFIDKAANYKVGNSYSIARRTPFVFKQGFKYTLENAKVGETRVVDVNGVDVTFVVTEAHKIHGDLLQPGAMFVESLDKGFMDLTYTSDTAEIFSSMAGDLATFYSAKPAEYKEKIDALIKTMISDPDNKLIMEDLANAYIVNSMIKEDASKSRKYSIIYRSKTGGYIFNINEYLRYHTDDELIKLTKISDLAKYTLKPSVTEGDNKYFGTVNEVFSKELPEYLQSSVVGIKVPSIMMTDTGVAYIRAAVTESFKVPVEEITYEDSFIRLLEDFDPASQQTDDLVIDESIFEDKVISLTQNDEEALSLLQQTAYSLSEYIKDKEHVEGVTRDKLVVAGILNAVNKVIESIAIAKKNGSIFGDPDVYLSDYAKNMSDKDNEFRRVLTSILTGYKGSPSVMLDTLGKLSTLGPDEDYAGGVVDALEAIVFDSEMLAILGSCRN